MAQVLGVGGVFFKSKDSKKLSEWYKKWLGVPAHPEWGASFQAGDMPAGGFTVWAPFKADTDYFDPSNIVELALEGGCNAVASTLGVLGSVSRKYAHRIPFLVNINHNEMLT